MRNTRRCSRGMVLAAGAVAIMVCGTVANASPIRFDNPEGEGHFVWYGGTEIGLDLTLDAASQPGVPPFGPTEFTQEYFATHSRVAGDYSTKRIQATGDPFLLGVDFGTPIPTSGFEFQVAGYTNYPGYSSPLPFDQPTYLGVEMDLGSGWQYGWIGGVLSSSDFTFDAFAWGYETEVGVPIEAGAVPEPGSLALLAFGAVAACGRRQRGN